MLLSKVIFVVVMLPKGKTTIVFKMYMIPLVIIVTTGCQESIKNNICIRKQ